MRRVFEGPLNFLDTSNNYGDAEERIGIVIRELGGIPEGFVLETKVDRDMDTGDFSGDRVRRSVEESLERLGLDRLGLVHLHDPEHISFEEGVARDGPLEALQQLRDEGVIAHLGVAGGPIDLMQQYIRTGAFDVVLTHNRFNLVDQSAEPLLEEAKELGVAVLNAAPFGGGILAGSKPVAGLLRLPRRPARRSSPASSTCDAACERHGVPLAAAALQFPMREPRITATLAGCVTPAEVDRLIEHARRDDPGRALGGDRTMSFPDGFAWGTATASYQIEGAVDEGGRATVDLGHVLAHARARSTTATPATSPTTTTTATPRTSRSWPTSASARTASRSPGRGCSRTGAARSTEAGVDFYSRLVDALLAEGITPWVTLYHWDLPQALEDAGGWPERDTAERFAEYAALVYDALGDRVRTGRRSTSRGARRSSATRWAPTRPA